MTECDLANGKCEPCHGEGGLLSAEEIAELIGKVATWDFADEQRAIHKKYEFKNFVDALQFVNKVGELAEAEGHHPDFKLGWGYVDITLTTHFFNALTRNDFTLAAKIDKL
jgi:4a-hydroxytetrahydrobiopterin dehydratase